MNNAYGGHVAVAWNGLPLYAAAMLRRAFDHFGEHVNVIGTRPHVPAQGMEDVLRQEVTWIVDENVATSFASLAIPVPKVFFVSGWNLPAFNALCREVKRNGGTVVVMVDNCYRGSVRQFVGAIAYRAFFGSLFDHAWVPGESARRLMRSYGVPENKITLGLYSCDSSTFTDRRPIVQRSTRFCFVGQFIERKNPCRVHEAFCRFRAANHGDASLMMYGSGPLRKSLRETDSISVRNFAIPHDLSEALNDSRVLVLTSLVDHWPLVVHEAASCGCLLILSDAIGSIPEFAAKQNARLVRATSITDLINAFYWATRLSAVELTIGSAQSIQRASAFSVDRWAETFRALCLRYYA